MSCAFTSKLLIGEGCDGVRENTYIRRVDGKTLGMTRATGSTITLGAVDERDIVVKLVVGDGVLELRVRAADELVSVANFEDYTAGGRGAERLGVFAAAGDLDGSRATLYSS